MNSFLIVSGSQKQRITKAKDISTIKELKNNPDLLIIKPELTIGIKQIRELQKFLSRKPYQSSKKTSFIIEADKLTIPAQNAFLKTLEEPPANSLIILLAPDKNSFLETITSRCQIMHLQPQTKKNTNENKKILDLIKTLLKISPGEKLQKVEKYTKSREEAQLFCKKAVSALHQEILENKTQQTSKLIQSFQKTHSLLDKNINVKLAINNLALNL